MDVTKRTELVFTGGSNFGELFAGLTARTEVHLTLAEAEVSALVDALTNVRVQRELGKIVAGQRVRDVLAPALREVL